MTTSPVPLGVLAILLLLMSAAGSTGLVPFLTRTRNLWLGLGFALGIAIVEHPFLRLPDPPEWLDTGFAATLAVTGGASLWFSVRRGSAAGDPASTANLAEDSRLWLRRFYRTDDLAALDRGIEGYRRVTESGPGDPSHTRHVHALTTALYVRYDRFRNLADLDEAIDLGHAARELPVRGRARKALVLTQLSNALRLRFDHIGSTADLQDALAIGRRAVDLIPDRSVHLAACHAGFAAVLLSEYERTGLSRRLDEAIAHVREAVTAARRHGYQRTSDLATLCYLLAQRGRRNGSKTDLDEAVETGRRALKQTRSVGRLLDRCRNNLALALRTRYEVRQTNDKSTRYQLRPTESDLYEAERLADQAIAATISPDAPERANHQLNLALALRLLSEHNRSRDETSESARRQQNQALQAARRATEHTSADAPIRIRAGMAWSEIAVSAGNYEQAVVAFENVIGLLPRLASRELHRFDQEVQLGRWSGIAGTAAACALSAGRHEVAVRFLEEGRGILASRAADLTGQIDRLRVDHPELAAAVKKLRAGLDAPAAEDRSARREHEQAWEQILEQVRRQPGFARFARGLSLEEAVSEGTKGPIIFVNIDKVRSDAILVDASGVRTVGLAVTPQEATRQARKLHAALGSGRLLNPVRQQDVTKVLGWMWDTIAEPVLAALGEPYSTLSKGEPPRVWWVPTGPLAQLPIHAAGHHGSGGRDSVIDRVISSYTPTIGGLAAARRRSYSQSSPRALVVAMPQTPGAAPIPYAAAEAETVRRSFTEHQVLLGSQANSKAVRDALPSHEWAHFACHGVIDTQFPSRGRLLLHDHENSPWTVADISRLRLHNPQLAYLSSCDTARTGERHCDEAIHLASAFQLAGFPHVVATLWRIPDRVAQEFAESVYGEFARADRIATAENAARAVHKATLAARDRYPHLPGVWSGFIHVGR